MATSFAHMPAITDGLVLFFDPANSKSYKFGNTHWTSLVGAQHGEIVGNPVFTTANNGAFWLGDSSSVIRCSNMFSNEFTNLTVNAWVRPMGPHVGETGIGYVVYKGLASRVGVSSFTLYVDTPNNRATWSVAGITSCFSNNAVSTSKWTMLTGTYSNGTLRLYVDGVLTSTLNNIQSIADNGLVSIGRSSVTGQYQRQFNGNIGIVQMYNRTLSDNEINFIHKTYLGRYQSPSPLDFNSKIEFWMNNNSRFQLGSSQVVERWHDIRNNSKFLEHLNLGGTYIKGGQSALRGGVMINNGIRPILQGQILNNTVNTKSVTGAAIFRINNIQDNRSLLELHSTGDTSVFGENNDLLISSKKIGINSMTNELVDFDFSSIANPVNTTNFLGALSGMDIVPANSGRFFRVGSSRSDGGTLPAEIVEVIVATDLTATEQIILRQYITQRANWFI
jgi:hypothetical protein